MGYFSSISHRATAVVIKIAFKNSRNASTTSKKIETKILIKKIKTQR